MAKAIQAYCIAAAIACIAPTAALAQSWTFRSARDPFTDLTTSIAQTSTYSRSLIVRCKDEQLEAYLAIVGYLGDGADVRYRFDTGEVVSNGWATSTDKSAVFADHPAEFAREIMRGSTLHIEVQGEYGSADRYSIPLAGSGAAVGRVLDACGVTRLDIFTPDGPIWRRVAQNLDEAPRSTVRDIAGVLSNAGVYTGPVDNIRRHSLYDAATRIWIGYWTACEAGTQAGTACASWKSSRRFDPDVDYPVEFIELLLEIIRQPAAPIDAPEAATSATPQPSAINNPSWSAGLRPEFPQRAADRGITSASVQLECSVEPDGSLSSCSILSETPSDAGFGQAALSAARRARLSPSSVDSVAAGGKVRFTHSFRKD